MIQVGNVFGFIISIDNLMKSTRAGKTFLPLFLLPLSAIIKLIKVVFMKCPFCGEEMQQGKLRTRGENYFVPDGCKTPMLYTKKSIVSAGAIPVSTDAIGASCEENWNIAYLCLKCRKYIADY